MCNRNEYLQEELKNTVIKYFENFSRIHNTYDVQRISNRFKTLVFTSQNVFDFFNMNLGWAKTVEGYLYYYKLNLRWVLGLVYLFHEFDTRYDDMSILYLKKYMSFNGCLSIDDRMRYEKIRKIFSDKIVKINKIFGN